MAPRCRMRNAIQAMQLMQANARYNALSVINSSTDSTVERTSGRACPPWQPPLRHLFLCCLSFLGGWNTLSSTLFDAFLSILPRAHSKECLLGSRAAPLHKPNQLQDGAGAEVSEKNTAQKEKIISSASKRVDCGLDPALAPHHHLLPYSILPSSSYIILICCHPL